MEAWEPCPPSPPLPTLHRAGGSTKMMVRPWVLLVSRCALIWHYSPSKCSMITMKSKYCSGHGLSSLSGFPSPVAWLIINTLAYIAQEADLTCLYELVVSPNRELLSSLLHLLAASFRGQDWPCINQDDYSSISAWGIRSVSTKYLRQLIQEIYI